MKLWPFIAPVYCLPTLIIASKHHIKPSIRATICTHIPHQYPTHEVTACPNIGNPAEKLNAKPTDNQLRRILCYQLDSC
jgi:hypothetical protein